jgi:protocatechuate 3,4-dioxygenase beta subunit
MALGRLQGDAKRAMSDLPQPVPMFHDDIAFTRRRILQLLGGAGLVTLVGCASTSGSSAGSTSSAGATSGAATTGSATTATTAATAATATATTATTAATAAEIAEIPEETAGPYPGDGSNGLNVLTQNGVVRSDIRSSFGSASGVAQGVPTTIKFTVLDTSNRGAPLAGAAVYTWHCDREGRYSGYSQGVTNENYLRGVQETDASGVATFTSIYPACYSGRWPHIHFEVYPSLAEATSAGKKLATSQIALTEDVSDTVYATDGYSQSVRNMTQVSLSTDMVFRDGAELETPTVTGSVTDAYVVTLKVGV